MLFRKNSVAPLSGASGTLSVPVEVSARHCHLSQKDLEKALLKAGIDTSRMYLKPVHRIFDLGFKQDDFPNATYLAERLLTLPTHPLVREEDLSNIIRTIKEAV